MANIRRMKEKADRHSLKLKPHVKTHQSADIGEWLKEAGIQAITVSSIRMATYFAEYGWNDITIAFPYNPLEADAINQLAAKVDLTLLISDEISISALEEELQHQVSVYIEVDTGSDRTGFSSHKALLVKQAAKRIANSRNLQLKGLYSHPGHSYRSRSRQEIKKVFDSVKSQMADLKEELETEVGPIRVCVGDTPCCSVGDKFEGIDEISPGNFVFYDLMQHIIGSCSIADIAVALAAPVVAVYPERQEVAVQGGAVHLSKDFIRNNNELHFGLPVHLTENGWSAPLEDCNVKALSQEHGIIKCSESVASALQPGDVIGILPVHSCLTADLMMGYTTLNGKKLNHIRTSPLYS